MILSHTTEALDQIECDALVLGMYSDLPLKGPIARFDEVSQGAITRLLEAKEITGKRNELAVLLVPSGVKARLVVIAGLGAEEHFTRGRAYFALATAARELAKKERGKVAVYLPEGLPADKVEAAVAGSQVGCTGADLYRTKKDRFPLPEIAWSGIPDEALNSGRIIGEAINLTRRLVNEPPSVIYPESFANQVAQMASEVNLEVEIWDQTRLEHERCGSLLAVAKGSNRPPRMVILTYRGGPADQAPLALVGKGVTFDSGGLSIKPTDGMKTMKCDMAGAATVVGAMQAIARLQLPVNVTAYCGLVENMLGGDAYKLGDVLHSRNGKTIEVLNTDAEGRLVLADVLDVCVERKPGRIIDLATLTGACVVALGEDIAGLMTNDDDWGDEVDDAADSLGELVWPLPMFDMFDDQIRSEIADIKNVGNGRWGGAITAAKFLEQFVGKTSWVHLDIAGPAFSEQASAWCDAGATGRFVKTLVEVARRFGK